MNAYRIRSATSSDSDLIARAIALSSGGYAQLGWEASQAEFPGLTLVQIGGRLYARDKAPFTWRNCVVAQAEEPLGVMLAYGIDADDDTAGHGGREDDDVRDVYYPVKMEVTDSWYICGMTVFQPWRDKGIGSRLLRFAEQQAGEHGFRQLSLIAFAQNEGSVRLYRRNGYRIVERRPIIPHPMIEYGGEALLMVAQI